MVSLGFGFALLFLVLWSFKMLFNDVLLVAALFLGCSLFMFGRVWWG